MQRFSADLHPTLKMDETHMLFNLWESALASIKDENKTMECIPSCLFSCGTKVKLKSCHDKAVL